MASSGNFCTLNPLAQQNAGTYSEGNLLFTHTASSWKSSFGTHGMKTGKWYWEAYQYEDIAGNGFPIGIYDFDSGKQTEQAAQYPGQSNASYGTGYIMYSTGQKSNNGTETSTSLGSGVGTWQCAFDADAGKLWFGKNNTWADSGNPAGGSSEAYASIPSSTWMPITCSYNDSNSENFSQNFGQDSTFAGRISAGGNADGNGFGDFAYAPPTGFLALCSANLPISDDIDPAGDDGADDNPTKNFNVVTFTGNSSTNVITGLGFKPDLIWGFTRDGAQDKRFIDSTRGGSSKITSNTTNNAATSNVVISEFGTDGFTANGGQFNNDNSKACGAWCWKANGGTTASNSNGTITSTVQANTKAGFSIVKFTGNGSNNATVGHGLDSAPDFIICKPYESGSLSWHVFSRAMGTGEFILNNNSAFSTRTTSFTESGTTATNFTLGSDAGNMNYSGVDTMAYCWHNVEGMQKFSIYTGNADADGPFVYTGFRPRLVAIKKASGSNDWVVTDTARNTVNPASKVVRWDSDAVESSSNREIDLLSNGFKPRTTNDVYNGSGGTYFYMAWGDVPFKYNNTF